MSSPDVAVPDATHRDGPGARTDTTSSATFVFTPRIGEGRRPHDGGVEGERSKSMSSFPDYVAKFRSKMVEIRSSFRRTARMGLYTDYWVPPSFPPK